MSIKLHELNSVEVNERELGSMTTAAAASGWSLVVSLWPFLHFTASSSHSLSSYFSFAIPISSSPLLVFLGCPASLSLPPLLSLVTLLIQNPSMNLSSLQRADDLSSVSIPLCYLSVCSISIPSPSGPAC